MKDREKTLCEADDDQVFDRNYIYAPMFLRLVFLGGQKSNKLTALFKVNSKYPRVLIVSNRSLQTFWRLGITLIKSQPNVKHVITINLGKNEKKEIL